MATWVDDIELAFFATRDEALRARKLVREALGSDSLRGVPLSERFVFSGDVPNRSSYIKNFMKKYSGGSSERLRREGSSLRQAAAKVKASVAGLPSRLKVDISDSLGRSFSSKVVKKLSTGRATRIHIPKGTATYKVAPLGNARIHIVENVLSFDLDDAVGELVNSPVWTKAVSAAQTADGRVVMDMSVFGIDLRDISASERVPILRQLMTGIVNGDIDPWLAKYG